MRKSDTTNTDPSNRLSRALKHRELDTLPKLEIAFVVPMKISIVAYLHTFHNFREKHI